MHRAGRAHEGEPRAPVIPLSRRALEILEEARALDGVPIGISDGDPGSGAGHRCGNNSDPEGIPYHSSRGGGPCRRGPKIQYVQKIPHVPQEPGFLQWPPMFVADRI